MIPANGQAEQRPTTEQAFPACHLDQAPEDWISSTLHSLATMP
jgi:hypothetical protein